MREAVGTRGLFHRAPWVNTGVVDFLLNLVQLQISMTLGALACYLLGRLITASPTYVAVYFPGSYLYGVGDLLFLAGPPAAWMMYRGHRLRQALGLAAAMLAPVVGIAVLGELTAQPYIFWLVTGMYPVMTLGMLAYMLYRRQAFTAVRSKR